MSPNPVQTEMLRQYSTSLPYSWEKERLVVWRWQQTQKKFVDVQVGATHGQREECVCVCECYYLVIQHLSQKKMTHSLLAFASNKETKKERLLSSTKSMKDISINIFILHLPPRPKYQIDKRKYINNFCQVRNCLIGAKIFIIRVL